MGAAAASQKGGWTSLDTREVIVVQSDLPAGNLLNLLVALLPLCLCQKIRQHIGGDFKAMLPGNLNHGFRVGDALDLRLQRRV